jgi:hypothetical protein
MMEGFARWPAASSALRLLRWALAAVLGLQGAAFAVASIRQGNAAQAALGTAEVAACVLLVPSITRRPGALALLAVLVIAAAVHVLAGQAPPVSYVVYAVATVAVASK